MGLWGGCVSTEWARLGERVHGCDWVVVVDGGGQGLAVCVWLNGPWRRLVACFLKDSLGSLLLSPCWLTVFMLALKLRMCRLCCSFADRLSLAHHSPGPLPARSAGLVANTAGCRSWWHATKSGCNRTRPVDWGGSDENFKCLGARETQHGQPQPSPTIAHRGLHTN